MARSKVLLTGAGGSVGRQLLPGLTAAYNVRVLDRTAVDAPDVASQVVGDLSDRDVAARALDGMDAVVHLAGNPEPDSHWADLEGSNVDAFSALLAAAQSHGVRRVVFASSVHAMGGYEGSRRWPIDPSWPPSPCCAYGATKAFDEALARAYAYRSPMSLVALRLGWTTPEPVDADALAGWLGPADLIQLVTRALEADVRFGAYHGVSGSRTPRWDIANAERELGYVPALSTADFAGSGAEPGLATCSPDQELEVE